MKARFYELTGLNSEGVPRADWHQKLALAATGFALRVELPKPLPGAPEKSIVIDEPVANVSELRNALRRHLPEAARLARRSDLEHHGQWRNGALRRAQPGAAGAATRCAWYPSLPVVEGLAVQRAGEAASHPFGL